MKATRSLLLCLLVAATANAGALGNAVAVDPSVRAAQPYADQSGLRASTFDGGAFFVWEDRRAGGLWPDVRGIRIGLDGGALDSDALLIASGPLDQDSADVACTDATCLVAWRNHDRVEVARFASNGPRLDATPVTLRTATLPLTAVSAGTNGSQFLVAWGHGANLEVQLVGLDGAPVGGVASLARAGDLRTSAIASDGAGWELAWSEYAAPSSENTRCIKFTPPSTFTAGPQILTTSSYPTFPDVAAAGSDGGGYIVVWHTYQPGMFVGEVLAKRLDSAGAQSGGTLTISTNVTQGFPSVAFDGTNYNILYRSPTSGLELAVVDRDGGRSAPVQLQTGSQSSLPAIATFESSPPVFAWSENYGTWLGGDIRHATLTTLGVTPANGVATLTSGHNQTQPAIAFGANEFLVVWQDDGAGRHEIWGARMGVLGQPLGAPFRISDATVSHDAFPAVSFDGENFLVAWRRYQSNATVIVTRVSPQGAVLDAPAPTSSLYVLDGPSAASDDAGSYFVWSASNGATGEDLFIMRVDRDGGLLDAIDSPLLSVSGNATETDPSVAIAGDGLCVVYTQITAQSSIQSYCWGNGYPGSTTRNRNISKITGAVQSPVLVRGAQSEVLFFGATSTNDAIEGRDWLRDGGSQVGFLVFTPSEAPFQFRGEQASPRAVFDGAAYSVVFELVTQATGTDVLLRRFGTDGLLIESLVIAGSVQEERMPALAAGPAGRVGIAYSAFDPATQGMRVYFRAWAEVSAGGVCAADAECAAGLSCVANVCGDGGVVGPDGGVGEDGGEIDAGAPPPLDRVRYGVGCGCDQSSGLWLLACVVAAAVWLRSRRHS